MKRALRKRSVTNQLRYRRCEQNGVQASGKRRLDMPDVGRQACLSNAKHEAGPFPPSATTIPSLQAKRTLVFIVFTQVLNIVDTAVKLRPLRVLVIPGTPFPLS